LSVNDDHKRRIKVNNEEGVNATDGKFSKENRRLLWGSRDPDLHAALTLYYGSEENYAKLSAVKQEVDPSGIFMADKFSVYPHPQHVIPTFGLKRSAVIAFPDGEPDRLFYDPPSSIYVEPDSRFFSHSFRLASVPHLIFILRFLVPSFCSRLSFVSAIYVVLFP
jgi:hypothetical protein